MFFIQNRKNLYLCTDLAQIYYLCPQNKKYFIEDLIEACNEALYEFNGMNKNTGERSSVKRRQYILIYESTF